MLKIAGKVLDVHDDVGLNVFRSIFPETEHRKIAEGVELLQPDELAAIDDNRFGAIFYAPTSGDQRRAYPMHTPEHTKLSAHYFVHSNGSFPEEVRASIAAQLAHGFEIHNMDPVDVFGEKTASEFLKWADAHGEWGPGDNFIDIELHDDPAPPEAENYAFSKQASNGMTQYVLPCDTEEQTRASIEAVLSNDAMEVLGLDPFELKKAASALKFAAEHHGVAVPDGLVQIACVEPRPIDDVRSLLNSRLDYMDPEKRASKAAHIKTAMGILMKESSHEALVPKIAMFDKACGIGEHAYMKGCPTPFSVAFVSGATKEASNDSVLEELGGLKNIEELLGPDVAKSFKEDARGALSGQPEEIRHILRHARD